MRAAAAAPAASSALTARRSQTAAGGALRCAAPPRPAAVACGARVGRLRVSAVFERFTERAIKAVMLAQQEAKAAGRSEVGTDHLLLGLIVEENSKRGYLNTGLSVKRARAAAAESPGAAGGGKSRGAASEVPFSAGSKRAFEQVTDRPPPLSLTLLCLSPPVSNPLSLVQALEESRKLGMSYLAPEHIALALLASEDAAVMAVLKRCSIDSPPG
jgi:ATP-dependent Clp protease ATP-binding subunit ClpC